MRISDWSSDVCSSDLSDANETQIKLVWYYNNILGRKNKKKIISRMGGYHGSSIASGSLTGLDAYHQNFDLPLDRIKHTIRPHWYRNARSEEHTSELQSLMRISYAVFCLKKQNNKTH